MIPRPRLRLRSPVGAGRHLRNERGAVLALMVLMLIVLLGLAALAIDLGLVFVARGEAQRTADAAAHAGAVHLSRAPADDPGARAAAVAVALSNPVRGVPAVVHPIDDIDVLLDSAKVRVRVHRTQAENGGIRTLFARVLGFGLVDVSTVAAAEVWTASQAECVLPIALPDRYCLDWNGTSCSQYSDGLDEFDPDNPQHEYIPWVNNPDAPTEDWVYNDNYTGYSDADRGMVINLRPPVGGGGGGPGGGGPPGGGGGGGGGGTFGITAWWSNFVMQGQAPNQPNVIDALWNCGAEVGINDELIAAPGFGVLTQEFQRYIQEDPNAIWNENANDGEGCVTDLGSMTCRDSVRIRPIVLFDPLLGPTGPANSSSFQVRNLVGVFLEAAVGPPSVPAPSSYVRARFIEYQGTRPATRGPGNGSLSRFLRIVE